MKRVLIICLAALAAGCAQSPAEQHAKHFAFHMSESLNGNYQNNHNYAYTANLASFQKMYALGKSDRAAGRTKAYADETANAIKAQLLNAADRETYLNAPQAGTTVQPSVKADAQLYASEMAATYLDGFEGR